MSSKSEKTPRITPRRQGFVLNGVGHIPIAGGGFAYVDEADFAAVSCYTWYWNSKGYAVRVERGIRVFMHHVIRPPKEGFEVDHKNRNRADNRSSNLRYATASQNRANRVFSNPWGYRGVRLMPSGKWQA